ncbi:D-alanyl-D-alanine dipeptidase [Cellulophaga sp. RHA19]|uniref:M15 family metallopeptidase n=1 Tax=Cellulophaga sp. RHA19 TaxID=1798237 RepID=UPI000C2C7B9F|nr:M15 family metallopeptidase [Cellulophaga sp. RHA19]PKB44688.1 D-alanyl-D-alanine dipeptidase [Cellulophaga sp. RHA19]
MTSKHLLPILLICITIACKDSKTTAVTNTITKDTTLVKKDTVVVPPVKTEIKYKSLIGIADTTFVRIADFSGDFAYDLRYATTNNFLKEKVYDCPECYTRAKTAKALLAANSDFIKLGYRIKFFDCYRPNSVQYKMWKIVPNPQYVANPKKGSIHNKGGAVDITLETLDGIEVDMGTDFDFFGKKAYHDNTNLPEEILANRKLLKETMEKHGFWSIRTEWWHYNLSAMSNAKVANFKWDCK